MFSGEIFFSTRRNHLGWLQRERHEVKRPKSGTISSVPSSLTDLIKLSLSCRKVLIDNYFSPWTFFPIKKMCISSKCNIEISVETLLLQQIEGLNYRPEKLDTCRYACSALLAASAYLNGHQPQGPCKVLLNHFTTRKTLFKKCKLITRSNAG